MSLTTVDSGIYFRCHVGQPNIQFTFYSCRRNSVKTRMSCSLLNCDHTVQVLQQVVNQRLETKRPLYYGNSENEDVQVCIL